MNTQQVKTIRMVALNQTEKQLDGEIELSAKNVQHLTVNIDFRHPNMRHFAVTNSTIRRIDDARTRLQVVATEKIPLGIWVVSLRVLSYGHNND